MSFQTVCGRQGTSCCRVKAPSCFFLGVRGVETVHGAAALTQDVVTVQVGKIMLSTWSLGDARNAGCRRRKRKPWALLDVPMREGGTRAGGVKHPCAGQTWGDCTMMDHGTAPKCRLESLPSRHLEWRNGRHPSWSQQHEASVGRQCHLRHLTTGPLTCTKLFGVCEGLLTFTMNTFWWSVCQAGVSLFGSLPSQLFPRMESSVHTCLVSPQACHVLHGDDRQHFFVIRRVISRTRGPCRKAATDEPS